VTRVGLYPKNFPNGISSKLQKKTPKFPSFSKKKKIHQQTSRSPSQKHKPIFQKIPLKMTRIIKNWKIFNDSSGKN
jgi:hypothetical protein